MALSLYLCPTHIQSSLAPLFMHPIGQRWSYSNGHAQYHKLVVNAPHHSMPRHHKTTPSFNTTYRPQYGTN
jgi:hypothetical protein